MTQPPVRDPGALSALGRERFVTLTTFRRSGQPVSTPVWVAEHDGALVVTTPSGSGKLKRLAHTARVLLRPCTRFGKVDPDVVPVEAVAEVLGPDAGHPELVGALRAKYRLEYRVIVAVEGLVRRRRGEGDERTLLRITAS